MKMFEQNSQTDAEDKYSTLLVRSLGRAKNWHKLKKSYSGKKKFKTNTCDLIKKTKPKPDYKPVMYLPDQNTVTEDTNIQFFEVLN